MIKPNDLRIGNIILNPLTGKFIPVTINNIYSDAIEPVQLTPTLLQKMGFTYAPCRISGADMWQGLPFWSCDEFVLRGKLSTSNGGEVKLAGYYNTSYRYVHQIQNLYYILTSKEINLEKIY